MQEIILLIILILFGSGLFSGGEVALVSVSKLKAKELLDTKRRNAYYLYKLKESFSETLITILIGNNLVNILASAIATKIAIDLFQSAGVGIATGVMTLLILTFGEIIPKTFSAKHAVKISLLISPIIYYLRILLTPLVNTFHLLSDAVNKLGRPSDEEKITENELKYMVRMGAQQGEIKKDENEMIQNILRFDDTVVSQVMTPRTEIFALRHDTKIKDAIPKIAGNRFSRIPIYKNKLDKIIGVVVARDLLEVLDKKSGEKTLSQITRDVLFVPNNKNNDVLLRELQKKSSHMAIVVNEHGGVEGLVTIEDLLEEIVGEIFDESDEIEELITKENNGKYKIKGKTPLRYLNKRLNLNLPIDEDINTLAGLLQKELAKVPVKGDKYKIEKHNISLKVEKTEGPVIEEITLKKN